jgi:hypothetical protein
MFIFNDIVDLFAVYGMVRLGRLIWNRRHTGSATRHRQ